MDEPERSSCLGALRVSGIVLDEYDRPVSDARVDLASEMDGAALGTTQTSWSGAFELSVTAPERECRVSVAAALAFRSTSGARVALVRGDAATLIHPGPAGPGVSIGIVRIRWSRPIYSVDGEALDPTGQPVTAIAVASRGNFRITHVCENEFRVLALNSTPAPIWIESKGFAPTLVNEPLLQRERHTMVLLERGSVLQGSVVDDAGQPVKDASVSLGFAPGGIHFKKATTSDNGTFEFDGLPESPLSWSLWAKCPGFFHRTQDFELRRAADLGEIRIRLDRDSGPAVVDILVSGDGTGDATGQRMIGFTPTDPGRDAVTMFAKDRVELQPGSYEVEARVPGKAIYRGSAVLAKGRNMLALEFVPGGRIQGRVRDIRGLAVEGAVVRAYQDDVDKRGGPIDCCESDVMGSFELDYLKEGVATLTVDKRGWKRTTATVLVRAQEVKTSEVLLAAER